MEVQQIKSASLPPSNNKNNKSNRIESIALEALKVLGLAIAGALMAGLSLASAGTIWLVTGIALGAATAIGSFGAGKYFIHQQKMRGFPAHTIQKEPPIQEEAYISNEGEKEFLAAFEKEIQPLPEYGEWKQALGNISDIKAKRIFRRAMRLKRSQGESYAMASMAIQRMLYSEKGSFRHPEPRDVYSAQIKFIMERDLKRPLSRKPEELKRRFFASYEAKQFPTLEDFSENLENQAIGCATFIKKELRQTLFFQVNEQGGRFYDGSHKLTGFHIDNSSRASFINNLHMHLKAGLVGKRIFRKQYDALEIELF